MAYRKSLPRGEFTEWVQREFEALEREVGGSTGTLRSTEVSDTVTSSSVSDASSVRVFTSSSDVAFVIEPASVQRIAPGSTINFYQQGTGTVRLIPGSGVTLVSRVGLQSAGQHAFFSAWHKEPDYWVAYGDLIASTSSVAVPGVGSLRLTGLAPTVS